MLINRWCFSYLTGSYDQTGIVSALRIPSSGHLVYQKFIARVWLSVLIIDLFLKMSVFTSLFCIWYIKNKIFTQSEVTKNLLYLRKIILQQQKTLLLKKEISIFWFLLAVSCNISKNLLKTFCVQGQILNINYSRLQY